MNDYKGRSRKELIEEIKGLKRKTYDRTLDEPYAVERGGDFYRMMNEVDALYKKYAHLKDATDELNSVANYDSDLEVKYRKANEFWRMLDEIFEKDKYDVTEVAEYTEVIDVEISEDIRR